jgi:hypothetical protein
MTRFKLEYNSLLPLFYDIMPKFGISERTRQAIKMGKTGNHMIETVLDPKMLL